MSPTEDKTAVDGEELPKLPSSSIDMVTFGQILEMDEPGSVEFSSSIVFDFFAQAEETFESMDTALDSDIDIDIEADETYLATHRKESDLPALSSLGHFLKGSSATLGLVRIRDGCEKIQRFGKKENLDGSPESDEEVCLKHITDALADVKEEYAEVEKALKEYYDKFDKEE